MALMIFELISRHNPMIFFLFSKRKYTFLRFLLPLFMFLFLFSCEGQNQQTKTTNHSFTSLSYGRKVDTLCDSLITIYHDAKGNYWFGSYGHGVYRFDGKQLIQYETQDGLLSNVVVRIQEDQQGRIFLDTRDGINYFENGLLQTLSVNPIDTTWGSYASSDLWFGAAWNKNAVLRFDGKHLYRYSLPTNPVGDSILKLFPGNAWSPYDIYSLYKDRKGVLWIGTSNAGVYRFDGKHLNWLYEHQISMTPEGGSFGIRSVLEDLQGYYWFCNTKYKYSIDTVNLSFGKALNYSKTENNLPISTKKGKRMIYFLSSLIDQDTTMWFLTYEEGIWCYDGRNLSEYHIEEDNKEIKLYAIYTDKQGRVWVSTHKAGAWYFNGKKFVKFSPNEFQSDE